MRAVQFFAAWHARANLEREAAAASAAWRAIPGTGTGPMGLTPDAVKFGPAYREAAARYHAAADRLKRASVAMRRAFPEEMRKADRMRSSRARIV